MASSVEGHVRKTERLMFLQRGLDFDETYRQALARVQFMKTRYKKAFQADDDGYDIYPRSKRLVSKFEYNQRKMEEMNSKAQEAYVSGDTDAFKKADAEYERYMKNCLYYAFGIAQLYNTFLLKAPDGLV